MRRDWYGVTGDWSKFLSGDRKKKQFRSALPVFVHDPIICAASSVAAADAAADYPNRPIRFIAPFVAGGPSDMLSRLLGQRMSERWGQSVIVDNRGSAGGLVGFEPGAKALPDGYTLLLANGAGLTINPHVYLKVPYDPTRDFQPITQVTSALIKQETAMYGKLVKQIGLQPQ